MEKISKKYSFFIASAYNDVREEKEVLSQFITHNLGHSIEEIQWPHPDTEMDHLYDGTTKLIKNTDIFILLLGTRIGTIRDDDNESWIAHEYKVAKRAKKPILVFLPSDDVFEKQQKEKPVESAYMLMKLLRYQVVMDHNSFVEYFSSPEQLVKKFQDQFLDLIEILPPPGNGFFEIRISTRDQSVAQVIGKLQALDLIYVDLCKTGNISVTQYPLLIKHIAVGSLWLKLFGETKIISIFSGILKSGIDYLHRNKTVEGRIDSVPKQIEVVKKGLELSKKMKEAGIDVEPLNNELNKSANTIATNLTRLLMESSNITVNDQQYLQREVETGGKYSWLLDQSAQQALSPKTINPLFENEKTEREKFLPPSE